ncbi:MAG TPA: aspartate aminotransferase family protein [Methylomirabilota bacterium]|nr:aspartate aminotransferase family protein [Methylomirabilota bacterium]
MTASSVFYRRPPRWQYPEVVRGQGVYLYDKDGKRYLDACGGALVVTIGHGVTEVADAVARQLEQLAYIHGTEFTSPPVEALARELARRAPMDEAKLYLVSGGSEATETAIKLARQCQLARGEARRYKVVHRWPSYHGASLGALAVSGRPQLRHSFAPILPVMPHIPAPYPYRCGLRGCGPVCSLACAEALDATIRIEGLETVAAFIFEPVVGASAGAVVPPPDYHRMVAEICRRHGVLLIADEVMSGMGRTGKWFGIEHWPGVRPDIITCGKGLTSGYVPGGAVLVKGEIAETVRTTTGFPHGFTYSHNPVAAAAALAVLGYVERHGLVARAHAMGEHLMTRLQGLLDLPAVGEVRGLGLLTAVEIVSDRATRASYPAGEHMAEKIQAEALRRGVVVYASGGQDADAGDLILVGPPFTIEPAQIDEAVATLGDAISAVTRR